MFGPEFVGGRGCLRRLGEDGPLVVVHRAQPRRTSPRDLVSAIDLSGRTLWTVPYSALYGDRERRAHRIDLVDDRVVVGVNVKSFFSVRIAVATIDADGTAHPAP